MITKKRWRTLASGWSSDGSSHQLGEALADVAKRFCVIRVPLRAWLVGLGLTVGITLTAGGSASADDQSSGPNAKIVNQLLAELGASPSTIARSGVPTCSSPASSSSPFVILDNQTYALCALATCFVFNDVAYCKCDIKVGDSLSVTDEFDTNQDVCTVNAEGPANGYIVSTFSVPPAVLAGGDMASYTCPPGSNGAYAQCDGGICFKSTQGKSFPGLDTLEEDEIVCSCPIVEQSPLNPVGYQISGPYPCQESFFENCRRKTANSNTGSTLYVGAPTGVPRAAAFILTGKILPTNECRLP